MDLSTLSRETLISIVLDLQNQVNKLKTDADIRITEIEKLLDSQIEIINKNPEKVDMDTQTENKEKKTELIYYYDPSKEYLPNISVNVIKYTNIRPNNVWYMNGNAEDLDKWDINVKNNYVCTWNDNGKNNSVEEKLNVNDIIAWYIVSKGYNSILRVSGEPHEITDKELKLSMTNEKVKDKRESMKKHNYSIIFIPVEFLASSTTHFVKKETISHTYDNEWSGGLRGSHCIKPNNKLWRKQVFCIYNYLKDLE
tara:strand:- start:33 stop:794 length:762 start_codon:yes stop_codon:yes gene_type:complete